MDENPRRAVALVFAGGIGLGAYEGGCYAALHESALSPDWVAASSVGAMNAAVIAGSAPELRVQHLRELWMDGENAAARTTGRQNGSGTPRHLQNWASVLQTRLLGRAGHFHPRYLANPFGAFSSFYDLSPLRARIEKLVDFGRLNSGEVRVCVAATDIESGEPVLFDTAEGSRLTIDHLLASCGFLPEFAPVSIDGRLLGDGGLSMNAPVEAVLLREPVPAGERVCFVVDLFAQDGDRPTGVESAFARKNDLIFANQTVLRLEACRRESELRDRLAAAGGGAGNLIRDVFYLSYRAPREEAGPEKQFDMSLATAGDRWEAGALDMAEAIRRLALVSRPEHGFGLHRVRR